MVRDGFLHIAGVDEVGRGCLFGPVVAAAVILSPTAAEVLLNAGVKDSKQLRGPTREILYEIIKTHGVDCRIGMASVQEIDRINILQASLLAMRRAIARLTITPDLCLIDGNRPIPNFTIEQRTIIKGDQTEVAILAIIWLLIKAMAAVSILRRCKLLGLRVNIVYPLRPVSQNYGWSNTGLHSFECIIHPLGVDANRLRSRLV
jgi:hypothetical protein